MFSSERLDLNDLLGEKIEDETSPRGERQGGDGERERVKLTALVPVKWKNVRACLIRMRCMKVVCVR